MSDSPFVEKAPHGTSFGHDNDGGGNYSRSPDVADVAYGLFSLLSFSYGRCEM